VNAPEARTAELLEAVEGTLRRYVVLPGEAEACALALWVAHSWAFDAAFATPYLTVLSPERRSGKTLLLEVLELLVRSPWRLVATSESALFRKIHGDRPTVMLDEVDAVFGGDSDRTEPLRAVLNAGNRPGSSVARCVGPMQAVVDFNVFGPKVLSGIDTGRLPDTIRDRAIEIRMRRKAPGESAERFRRRFAEQATADVRAGLEEWAADAVTPLRDAEPSVPADLNDRAADAWEPLLAIADLAAGGWPARARQASLALAGEEADDATHGTRVLAALKAALGDRRAITTADLVTALNDDDELPYGGWRDGRGIDARAIARLLKPYGLKPRSVRLDTGTAKGYSRDEDLEDAFARYLAPDVTGDPSQTPDPSQETPLPERDVTVVPDVTANPRAGGEAALRPPDALFARPCRCTHPLADEHGGCALCGHQVPEAA